MSRSDYAAVFFQVPEQKKIYERNDLSLKIYSETMTYADLTFGIALFAVIVKEKIVFSGLIKVFISKNFSLCPLCLPVIWSKPEWYSKYPWNVFNNTNLTLISLITFTQQMFLVPLCTESTAPRRTWCLLSGSLQGVGGSTQTGDFT